MRKLKSCPFCKAESFEEICPEGVRWKEQRFDRINHKPDCYMNYSGDEFERFPRHNNKDADAKYTPDEERQRWNRRAK